jgi:hypothetical protein
VKVNTVVSNGTDLKIIRLVLNKKMFRHFKRILKRGFIFLQARKAERRKRAKWNKIRKKREKR